MLHNEVHARPSARIRLPALVVLVAVLNEGVTREDEWRHLRGLPGQAGMQPDEFEPNFLRLRCGEFTLKWERHSEFSRYSMVQALPAGADLEAAAPDLAAAFKVDTEWLRNIPGRTIAAIQLVLLERDITDAHDVLAQAQRWLGSGSVVASLMGQGHSGLGHSMVVTDFRLRGDGFERILVIGAPQTSAHRAGRISQRLLELEIYRLMALRGLPAAKALAPMLAESEAVLADLTAQMEAGREAESRLLDQLIHLAAGVERATAQHMYRFSATKAYEALVRHRMNELRERSIPGTQTLTAFLERRLTPASATVAATAQRLASLSERIERASALLRTRVDIAAETQNQELLAKLTRGQSLQLTLQSTVEGLSIAAISYYVVSLFAYVGKALKSLGLPVNPDLMAGLLIPVVLWAVWRATRRIHDKLFKVH